MSDKSTILQILPALNSGGVEQGTIEIADAIVSHGLRSIVVSSGGRMLSELKRTGSEHIELPVDSKHPWVMWKNIRRLRSIIKRENVKVIHARSRAPAWSAYYAAKKMKIPFITTFHGVYNFEGKWKHRYNSIMTKGDTVIAVSNYVRDHILDHYEIDPAKIKVIHRGVDLKVFNPNMVGSGALENVLSNWRITDVHPPIILMPGRLTRWKGHEVLIKALAQHKDEEFLCVMMGDDINHSDYREEMQRLIHTLGLESKIRFADNTKHMTEAYQLADMVIVPSIEPEAFGRVPVEAQAMGKIVISTNHGGACETVIHGQTGLLVEPGNVTQLAEAIGYVLKISEQERYEVGCAAMTHVYENFSADRMKEKTIAIYNSYVNVRRT